MQLVNLYLSPKPKKTMRKEIFFALLTGIAFVLVVAFGIWKTNYQKKPPAEEKQNVTSENSENKERTPEKEVTSKITILKPEENELLTEESVIIEGISEPNTKLVISAENDDYLLITDQDGGFKQEVRLVGGLNEILITAFTQKGESSILLPLVYSKELAK